MIQKSRSIWPVFGVLITSALTVASLFAQETEQDFDRLDGKGKSLMRVDVIEWEGNLELHFYPKGRLKGLGFKMDHAKKDKSVMVISYRFTPPAGRTVAAGEDKPLIRRAILGISLQESFKVFQDPSVSDYDKVVISNHSLSAPLMAFATDKAPTQLYPEGHPLNNSGEGEAERSVASPKSVNLGVPQTRDVLYQVDDLNPELRVKPQSGFGAAASMGEQNRIPAATTQPTKFQNPKVDENTSEAVQVKEVDLNKGFNW